MSVPDGDSPDQHSVPADPRRGGEHEASRGGPWPEGPSPWRFVTGAPSGIDRRIFLVSPAFPPCTEVGAARWEGFAPFVTAAGWGIDVVMQPPESFVPRDWGRVDALPAGIRAIAVPRPQQGWVNALVRAKRLAARLRGRAGGGPVGEATSVQLPDDANGATRLRPSLRERIVAEGRIAQSDRWIRNAVRLAVAVGDATQRVVISSGPPNIAHVAAARLARALSLPYILDMRDPWTESPTAAPPASRLGQMDGEAHEAETLLGAAHIIANTPESRDRLVARFPSLVGRTTAIRNGSDLEPIPASAAPVRERFVIAHTGTLYIDRDPRPLLRAVAQLRRDKRLTACDIGVVFMGVPTRIAGEPLAHWARLYGIDDLVEERPMGSRAAARALLLSSAVGVAFQGRTLIQIPAKVFEYVAFPIWLLALVGEGSATAHLLQGSDAVVLSMHDEAGIRAALARLYDAFLGGARPAPVGLDGRFSRRQAAERLLQLVDAVVAAHR